MTKFFMLLIVYACLALGGCGESGDLNRVKGDFSENLQADEEAVLCFLNSYFAGLYCAVLGDSEQEFSPEDFESVNAYIVAKDQIRIRECYRQAFGGIRESCVESIDIEEMTAAGDRFEASVYVKHRITCGDENQSTFGYSYFVELQKTEEGYVVKELDSDDICIQNVKDAIRLNDAKITEFEKVDQYFEDIVEGIYGLDESAF